MKKDFYFDKDDSLNRKNYAVFLQNILENNEQNRRDDSNDAYVLAVDSPWGTGKTRFAIMLKNHLEERYSADTGQHDNANRKFNAIYYDALSSDYNPDAMEPLMHALVNSTALKVPGAADDLEKLKIACTGILKMLGYGIMRVVLGEAGALAALDTEHMLGEKDQDPLESYTKKLELYDTFRKTLASAIKRSKKKLVIIIDELDRCKPTFAIQTIEMAKHLFDVKGLIFVFFLDITQLSSAVKCVYGSDMDATGYLCRYFDFISRLPTPDTIHFIEMKLKTILYYQKMAEDYSDATAYILKLSQTFQLSLRDISTIMTNYAIMCSTILQNYSHVSEHRIYLFLLVLKYKNLELYNTIVSETVLRDEQEKFLNSQAYLRWHSMEFQCLQTMIKRIPLRELSLPFKFAGKPVRTDPVTILGTSRSKSRGELSIQYKLAETDKALEQVTQFREHDSWGGMLYFYDLKNWVRIKDITLAEHFSRRLDHFEFQTRNLEPQPISPTIAPPSEPKKDRKGNRK